MRAYRTPVIVLLTRKWMLSHDDAEDMAHDFFARALEKDWFSKYDGERGRFRTFLRSCLFAFAADEHDRVHRRKRGGDAPHEPLTEQTSLPATDNVIDTLFEEEWIRSVLQLALDALRVEAEHANRAPAFAMFEEYDVQDNDGTDSKGRRTYAELALAWNVPTTQVTNYLSWARKRFRHHVLSTVRSLTGSDAEYREELRTLLGVVPE
ncbi:MAG: hypothetical protein ABJB74_11865 [Gemmatimonas sp.]